MKEICQCGHSKENHYNPNETRSGFVHYCMLCQCDVYELDPEQKFEKLFDNERGMKSKTQKDNDAYQPFQRVFTYTIRKHDTCELVGYFISTTHYAVNLAKRVRGLFVIGIKTIERPDNCTVG